MPGRELKDLTFSNDGRFLAVGGYGNGRGLVEVRDVPADKIARIAKFDSAVNSLDLSGDGTRLVIGTDDGHIVLLKV